MYQVKICNKNTSPLICLAPQRRPEKHALKQSFHPETIFSVLIWLLSTCKYRYFFKFDF